MQDQDTAELIFGGPVDINVSPSGSRIKKHGASEDYRLGSINLDKTGADENFKNRLDSALYTVTPMIPIKPGEVHYFRLRFRVFGVRPLWTPKHYMGGVFVDFRVCDVRESRHVDHERSLRPRMAPIESTDVFLMVPEEYQIAAYSPATKYIRVLEPHAWRKYNDGADYRRANKRYLVYSWRSGDAITNDLPLRIFADFNRNMFSSPWRIMCWIILALGMAVCAAEFARYLWHQPNIQDFPLKYVLTFLGLSTIAGATARAKSFSSWLSNRAFRPRQFLRAIERFTTRYSKIRS